MQELGVKREDVRVESSPEERAVLAVKALKAKFPLSDKFLQSLLQVIRMGVDLSTICAPSKVQSVLTLEDPTTVGIMQSCSGCNAPVQDVCNKPEYGCVFFIDHQKISTLTTDVLESRMLALDAGMLLIS